jgi:hypothetical protein
MTTIAKIKGVEIELNGEKYTCPPLNLNGVEKMQDKLQDFDGLAPFSQLPIVAEVAHLALLRNYPDITLDAVKDGIDLGNMIPIMNAVMGVSGLVKSQGE